MRRGCSIVALVLAVAAGCRQNAGAVIDAAVSDVAVSDVAVTDATVIDASVIDAAIAPACSWAEVTTGSKHTCGRKTDGTLWCWGEGSSGQLGGGGSVVQVTALGTEAVELSAGGSHTCARKADGTLWCWGSNYYGQVGTTTGGPCGIPAGSCHFTPVQVTALGTEAVEVSAGGLWFQWWNRAHTCGRQTDGTLWCWGSNFHGQLGDGTTTDTPTAVQVTALGDAVAELSAGGEHTCARKTDGTLWCWGSNSSGELGDGTITDRLTPVQVTALGNAVVELSAGGAHTCARKTDGTLWCWGWNASGEVGDGTKIRRATPVQVTALGSAVVELSAGGWHTCARTNNGKLWCWGSNGAGQIGDGGAGIDRLTPVQVTTLGSAVVEVSASDEHTCARKTDGTLWCWGSGYALTPKQVCM